MVDLSPIRQSINLDVIANADDAMSGLMRQGRVNTSSLDCIIGQYAYKYDGHNLVSRQWIDWCNVVFANSGYFSNAYNSLKSYSLNDFVVYNHGRGKGKEAKNEILANALDNSFYAELQEQIFNAVLVQGGIAFYCYYDKDTLEFIPHIVPFSRIRRVYDNNLKEYHYENDDINLELINTQLELAGLERVVYVSQLPNFRIYFYDNFLDGMPKPRLHASLKLLITLLMLDDGIYRACEQNIWLKDLIVKLKDNKDTSRHQLGHAGLQDPDGSKKRTKLLDQIFDFFRQAQDTQSFRSKSVLTYDDNLFEMSAESMLESPATAKIINDILLDRLPSAMGVSAKALGINKGSSLNDSGNYEIAIDSQAGEDVARFIGRVITDLYKLHAEFAGEAIADDFIIEIAPSSQSISLRQGQELINKKTELELKKQKVELLKEAQAMGYTGDINTIINEILGDNI